MEKRVKSMLTTNVGTHYEVISGVVANSIVTDADGTKVSEIRYKAWGEIRYESGASPTDYAYTGQYSCTADFGLMFYNALVT